MKINRKDFSENKIKHSGLRVDNLESYLNFLNDKYCFFKNIILEYYKSKNKYYNEEDFLNMKDFLILIDSTLEQFEESSNTFDNEKFYNIINNLKANIKKDDEISKNNKEIFSEIILKILENKTNKREIFKIVKDKLEILETKKNVNLSSSEKILDTKTSKGFVKDNNKDKSQLLEVINFNKTKTKTKTKTFLRPTNISKKPLETNSVKKRQTLNSYKKIVNKKIKIKQSDLIFIKNSSKKNSIIVQIKAEQIRRKKRLNKLLKLTWLPFKLIFNLSKFILILSNGIIFFGKIISSAIFSIGKFVTNSVKKLFSKQFWEKGFGRYFVSAILSSKKLLFWTVVFFTLVTRGVLKCINNTIVHVERIKNFNDNVEDFLKTIDETWGFSPESDKRYSFVNFIIDTIRLAYAGFNTLKHVVISTVLTIIATTLSKKLFGEILSGKPFKFFTVTALAMVTGNAASNIYNDQSVEATSEEFQSLLNNYLNTYNFFGDKNIRKELDFESDLYKEYLNQIDNALQKRRNTSLSDYKERAEQGRLTPREMGAKEYLENLVPENFKYVRGEFYGRPMDEVEFRDIYNTAVDNNISNQAFIRYLREMDALSKLRNEAALNARSNDDPVYKYYDTRIREMKSDAENLLKMYEENPDFHYKFNHSGENGTSYIPGSLTFTHESAVRPISNYKNFAPPKPEDNIDNSPKPEDNIDNSPKPEDNIEQFTDFSNTFDLFEIQFSNFGNTEKDNLRDQFIMATAKHTVKANDLILESVNPSDNITFTIEDDSVVNYLLNGLETYKKYVFDKNNYIWLDTVSFKEDLIVYDNDFNELFKIPIKFTKTNFEETKNLDEEITEADIIPEPVLKEIPETPETSEPVLKEIPETPETSEPVLKETPETPETSEPVLKETPETPETSEPVLKEIPENVTIPEPVNHDNLDIITTNQDFTNISESDLDLLFKSLEIQNDPEMEEIRKKLSIEKLLDFRNWLERLKNKQIILPQVSEQTSIEESVFTKNEINILFNGAENSSTDDPDLVPRYATVINLY